MKNEKQQSKALAMQAAIAAYLADYERDLWPDERATLRQALEVAAKEAT